MQSPVKLKFTPETTTCPPDEALLPDLDDTDTEEGIVIGRAAEKGNASDIRKAVR